MSSIRQRRASQLLNGWHKPRGQSYQDDFAEGGYCKEENAVLTTLAEGNKERSGTRLKEVTWVPKFERRGRIWGASEDWEDFVGRI